MDFEKTVWEIKGLEAELLLQKHEDYGPGNIGNCPLGATAGLIVRLHDKLQRLANLYQTGRLDSTVVDETVIDTAQDIANYGTILQMVLRGEWPDAT